MIITWPPSPQELDYCDIKEVLESEFPSSSNKAGKLRTAKDIMATVKAARALDFSEDSDDSSDFFRNVAGSKEEESEPAEVVKRNTLDLLNSRSPLYDFS